MTDNQAPKKPGPMRLAPIVTLDAKFFWENDLRIAKSEVGMEGWLESLSNVTFHNKLGTQAARIDRIAALAREIAPVVGADADLAEQAAKVAKADLSSEMVYEFPELQGLMGRYYAEAAGLPQEVANACQQHYSPLGPSDEVPTEPVSVAVALADKIDTLTGFWAIDEKPTGSKDPFALRRASIGVLRIIVEKSLPLDLVDLVEASITTFGEKIKTENLQTNVVDFVLARFRAWYGEQGIAAGVIQAVAVNRPTRPADFAARVEAVKSFNTLTSAEALAAANKRVANILAKNANNANIPFDADLLQEPAELALARSLESVEARIRPMVEQSDYTNALVVLAELREPIDGFFENVMVMADNEAVKLNRLSLLSKLRNVFLCCADISVLN